MRASVPIMAWLLMLAHSCVDPALAQPAPAGCPGVAFFVEHGVNELPEGCPAPITGWLYTQSAHALVSEDRREAAQKIGALISANEKMRQSIAGIEDPPSRLVWFLAGIGAAVAVMMIAMGKAQ